MIVVMVATGLYAGGTYAYKKIKDSGESFSWEKFLPTMGIGALSAITLYIGSGAIPGLDEIFTQIDTMMPGGAMSVTVVLAAILAVVNQILKGTQTSAAGASVETATVPTTTTTPSTITEPATTTTVLPVVINTITVTGPFGSDKVKVSLTGTRIIQAAGGAFQLINDGIAQNFIVASAGPNAIFSGEYSFSGNLTLITYGELY